MTVWLLVRLVAVLVCVLMWRSERRARQIHGPGSGSGDSTSARDRGGQFYSDRGSGGL